MLTLEKLKTYRRFGGDIDGYSRTRGRGDSSGITDDDWKLIDELLMALHIVASGKASGNFATALDQRLLESAPDPQTRKELNRLANVEL
jgi:hypothetical protein